MRCSDTYFHSLRFIYMCDLRSQYDDMNESGVLNCELSKIQRRCALLIHISTSPRGGGSLIASISAYVNERLRTRRLNSIQLLANSNTTRPCHVVSCPIKSNFHNKIGSHMLTSTVVGRAVSIWWSYKEESQAKWNYKSN